MQGTVPVQTNDTPLQEKVKSLKARKDMWQSLET